MNALPRSSPASAGAMLWLVLGLPLAVIVAGVATLVIALRAGGADAIPWEVRRTAQIQIEDRAPDLRAAALDLRARLTIDPTTRAVALALDGDTDTAERALRLRLVHPVHAGSDVEVALLRRDGLWQGTLPAAPAAAWTLRLDSEAGRWRVYGRWDGRGSDVALAPSR